MKKYFKVSATCGAKEGLLPFYPQQDNEQPVDNYMKNLWISDEENVNCTEPNTIHDGYPQFYPQVFLIDFNDLAATFHGIHRYNTNKQQLINIYYR